MIFAEASAVGERANPRSIASLSSFRDSSPSGNQLDNPHSSLQSSLGMRSKESTAPSTWFSDSLLDQVEKSSAATSLNEVHQTGSSSRNVSDDLESIASIPDSIDSTASTSHSLGQVGVNYIVAKFTQCDPELNKLYTEASQKLTRARFVDNNRRLLKLFYLDIAREVQTSPQAEAAAFLKSRKRRNAISSDIFQTMIPDYRLCLPLMQREGEFSELDRYLNTLEPIGDLVDRDPSREVHYHATDQDTDNEREGSSDEDSEIGSDNHEAPPSASSLQATGNFLVTSHAFASYKQRLHDFLCPSHDKKLETARPPTTMVTTSDSQLALHHEKGHENEDSKSALSEDKVSKHEDLENDRLESQNRAVSIEAPAVARGPEPNTNLTPESFDESFPYTPQDIGIASPIATIPLSTRVRTWITDRLWPPQTGSQRIWYLCVSIHFSTSLKTVIDGI